MSVTRRIALTGASLALVAVAAAAPAAAGAAGSTISVRVEGVHRTLLPTKVVRTHAGSIRTGGTPAGACPSTTAAGALDVATAHRWSGTYGTYGLSVTQILGETHAFSSKDYWSIWVDNKFAPAGICGLKLHSGEQLLFAAVPVKGIDYPVVISGPKRATAGQRFTLKVSYVNAKGKAQPLAGARVHGATGVTSPAGTVSVTAAHKGTLVYTAAKTGFIRSAAATVSVS